MEVFLGLAAGNAAEVVPGAGASDALTAAFGSTADGGLGYTRHLTWSNRSYGR